MRRPPHAAQVLKRVSEPAHRSRSQHPSIHAREPQHSAAIATVAKLAMIRVTGICLMLKFTLRNTPRTLLRTHPARIDNTDFDRRAQRRLPEPRTGGHAAVLWETPATRAAAESIIEGKKHIDILSYIQLIRACFSPEQQKIMIGNSHRRHVSVSWQGEPMRAVR